MFKKLLIASAALGALAFPSGAGAIVNSNGVERCPGQVFEQAFLQFGDKRHYTAVDNGNFEDGLNGWDVSGDVALTPFVLEPASLGEVLADEVLGQGAPLPAYARSAPMLQAGRPARAERRSGPS